MSQAHASDCAPSAPVAPRAGRLAGVVLLAMTAAAAAEPALRYRLEPGTCLVYEHRATVFAGSDTEAGTTRTSEVQVWCLQRSGSGVLLLVVLAPPVEGQAAPARSALLYVDENGRRRLPEGTITRLGAVDPALDILPMLPLTTAHLGAWTTPEDVFARRWRCTSRGPDPAQPDYEQVAFELDDPAGVMEVLGQARSGQFWFDREAGHVVRCAAETRDEQAGTRTHTSTTLRRRATRSATWAARRAEEAERYLRTLRHEDRLLGEVTNRPAELTRTLQQLDQLWATFAADVDGRAGSPFAQIAESRRQQLRADAGVLRARAALALRWLNQPARTWSLQDASGTAMTSERVRRGVVIECFWSASTPDGLRVLEPLRRWTTEPGHPVVPVLCYNMDFNLAVARRAIERCGSGLTQIIGGPLQDVEGLREFPVIRVVDGAGLGRGVWVGWDTTYAAARALAQRLARESAP